jgi:hypothetical protein
VKIGGGKAENVVAGIQEGVLPSQIARQAILVVLTVELDNQPHV